MTNSFKKLAISAVGFCASIVACADGFSGSIQVKALGFYNFGVGYAPQGIGAGIGGAAVLDSGLSLGATFKMIDFPARVTSFTFEPGYAFIKDNMIFKLSAALGMLESSFAWGFDVSLDFVVNSHVLVGPTFSLLKSTAKSSDPVYAAGLGVGWQF
jgi:hypothetical protein